MTRRRRTVGSDDEVRALAESLVGLSLADAERRAAEAGYRVSDRTGPGWFTDDHDPARVRVVVRDAVVVEAVVG